MGIQKKKQHSIQTIGKAVDALTQTVDGHSKAIAGLTQNVTNLTKTVDKLIGEVIEIKSTMVTKDELHTAKNEIMGHIDGLYKKTETLDQELTSHGSRTGRLEHRVTTIETHLGTA